MVSTLVHSLPDNYLIHVGVRVEIVEGPYEGWRGRVKEIRTWNRMFTEQLLLQDHRGKWRSALPGQVVRI